MTDRCFEFKKTVDYAPYAEKCCTDGYFGYLGVIYQEEHIRNMCDKSDIFTVEGVNADLRHYIPILRRRNRYFPRKPDTLKAVVEGFVDVYNRFGETKTNFRQNHNSSELPFSFLNFPLNPRLITPIIVKHLTNFFFYRILVSI